MKKLFLALIVLINLTTFGQNNARVAYRSNDTNDLYYASLIWIYTAAQRDFMIANCQCVTTASFAPILGNYWLAVQPVAWQTPSTTAVNSAVISTVADWSALGINSNTQWSSGGTATIVNPYILNSNVFVYDRLYKPTNSTWAYKFWDIVLATNEFTPPKLSVYPNPTKDFLHIDLQNELSGKISDLTGKTLMNINTKDIDVSSLSAGIYLLDIVSEEKHYVSKIVKE